MPRRKLLVAGALLAPIALLAAACGSEDSTAPATTEAEETTTTMADEPTGSATDSAADMAFGPACAAVPADGAGSFDGMAADPVATAASNNPVLSTLVTAVVEADLVDTLNTGGPWTVFAPINDAFAALPADDLGAVLADTDLLNAVLTYHVVAERLGPDDLQGDVELTTVNGASVSVSGEGEDITVNGAEVVCGNVMTANATVYLIDEVLIPA